VKCAVVNLLCYIGAKYHIVITRNLNLFLRKSIKLLPPELLLLAQICTKSFVGWGFAPDPTRGAYSALQIVQAGNMSGKGRGGEGVPVKFCFFAQQAQSLYLFTKSSQYELVFPLLAYIYAIYQPANINNTAEDNSHRIRNKPSIHALAITLSKAGSNCSFYKTTN